MKLLEFLESPHVTSEMLLADKEKVGECFHLSLLLHVMFYLISDNNIVFYFFNISLPSQHLKGKKRKGNDPVIKSPGSSNLAGGKSTKVRLFLIHLKGLCVNNVSGESQLNGQLVVYLSPFFCVITAILCWLTVMHVCLSVCCTVLALYLFPTIISMLGWK